SVWSVSESGGKFTGRRLVAAGGVAALSPDLRTLAYVSGSVVSFRDTTTGATRRQPMTAGGRRLQVAGTDFGTPTATTLFTFPPCLRWSPDGRPLVFLDRDGNLYVATPDGHAVLVDRPQTAEYRTSNLLPFGSTFRSYVGCGAWLDDRRFVFDRIGHGMP